MAERSPVQVLRELAVAFDLATVIEIRPCTSGPVGEHARAVIVDALRATALTLEMLNGRKLADVLGPTGWQGWEDAESRVVTPAYARELSHARRDAGELSGLLSGGDPGTLSTEQLMAAIGLATTARDALLRAAAARETEAPQP